MKTKPRIYDLRFTIYALLLFQAFGLYAPPIEWREATSGEAAAGTAGPPAVMTPRRSALATGTLTNLNGLITSGTNSSGSPVLFQSGIHYINVKLSPWNAVGDGIHDDWTAIQGAITAACLTNVGPVSVYIPAGTYRLTNTLSITTQTNSGLWQKTREPSLESMFGDGQTRSVLLWNMMTNGNGIEFQVVTNDSRHLSDFTLHNLSIFNTNGIRANTNVTGSGVFFGYDPILPYTGDTAGDNDRVENCAILGWRTGINVTNIVRFTVKSCVLNSNVNYGIFLAHADSALLENNVIDPLNPTNDQAAIFIGRDISASVGSGVTILSSEIGDSCCALYNDGNNIKMTGGNFERNNVILYANGLAQSSLYGLQISGYTNAPFIFNDNGASGFWAENCNITGGPLILFDQRSGGGSQFFVHHNLSLSGWGRTNGLWNGSPTNWPAVSHIVPQWNAVLPLANAGSLLNCSALSINSPSPSPFSNGNGVSIVGTPGGATTGWVQNAIPNSWGPFENGVVGYDAAVFTIAVQGGTGCTNAFITLEADAYRTTGAGLVLDQNPTFIFNKITNGMLQTFTWTNTWSDDTSARLLNLKITTTNTIYIIGLNGRSSDY